ncbi:hypothetical protein Tco_1143677, partial [Tanacetum coccineum]
VAVTPKNKVKKVRFAKPLTSSSNIQHVESLKTLDSNTPVLSSTGLKCSTSKCGSKPIGNKKNDRILRPTIQFRIRASFYDFCNIQFRTRSKPFQEADAPRAMDLADSPVSTLIDQDAPSLSTPSTQEQEQS